MPRPETAADPVQKNLKVLARSRSKFNDVFVIQSGDMREMWFNGDGKFFLQSRVDVNQPFSLALVYSKMAMLSLLFHPRPKRILIIGLGGGCVSNCLNRWYPGTRIDVVEIDPKVIALARKYFFIRETPNYRILEEDGRRFIKQQLETDTRYDIILLDAFKSGSIPYHLKTLEFYQEIKQVLTENGVVASNLYGKSNPLKPRDRNTFLEQFRQVYIFEDADRVATVSLATDKEPRLSEVELNQLARDFNPPPDMDLELTEPVKGYLPNGFVRKDAPLFQDDFNAGDFDRAIEKHNRRGGHKRPYPIDNVS